MNGDTAIWFGVLLLLFLGFIVGWISSKMFHDSAYKKLLDASIEVNRITVKSLEESIREIKERRKNDQQ